MSKVPPIQSALVEMAWQVAIPFMLFALGGNWLDAKFETRPLFTIIGLFVGLGAVTALVYRIVEKYYPGTFKKEEDK